MLARENLMQLLQGRGVERFAGAVNLLLVLWAAFLLAQLTWRVFPAPATPEPRTRLQAAVSAGVKTTQAAPIAEWHLFGTAAHNTPTANQPINAPETHLNLVLRGVLSSSDVAHARAIIADPHGNENYYAVGADLPGGAELIRIYPDRVILRRSGRYETLKLPKDEVSGAAGSNRSGNAGASGNRAAGQLLKHYRNALARNPGELLQLARPQAVIEHGRFVGFRLHPGERPALLGRLGLHNGDIVTAINGVRLNSPGKGIKALQDLKNAKSVNLTVRRGGRQIHLAFQIP
ncbi:MAG TPA: type II secretion system protein GspC [Gammaproteobacteria bacterium]|nr:type II secretion system protein GspC [Gammaproteobacteria bacterium]